MNFNQLVYQYVDIEINKKLKKLRAARRWLRCQEQLLDTKLSEAERQKLLQKKKRLEAKHYTSWMRQLVGLDRHRHERNSISDREHLRRAEFHIVGRILALSSLRHHFACKEKYHVKLDVEYVEPWMVPHVKATVEAEAKRFKAFASQISRQHAKSLALLAEKGSTEA